ELLAVDPVLRHFGGEDAAHRLLGRTVGDGHGRGVTLALGGDRLAEMRPDRRARGVGESMGEGDFDGEVHSPAGTATGSPSSCTRMTIARIPSGPAFGVWTVSAGITKLSPAPSERC